VIAEPTKTKVIPKECRDILHEWRICVGDSIHNESYSILCLWINTLNIIWN